MEFMQQIKRNFFKNTFAFSLLFHILAPLPQKSPFLCYFFIEKHKCMADVVQWLERQTVNLDVVGSSPIIRPIIRIKRIFLKYFESHLNGT